MPTTSTDVGARMIVVFFLPKARETGCGTTATRVLIQFCAKSFLKTLAIFTTNVQINLKQTTFLLQNGPKWTSAKIGFHVSGSEIIPE